MAVHGKNNRLLIQVIETRSSMMWRAVQGVEPDVWRGAFGYAGP